MPDSQTVESWTWYGVASLFTICRFISRCIRLGGIRFFELEDHVMILAFSFYTNLIVWVYIQQKHPRTNILPPTGIHGLSPAEIDDRIYGSKITFTIEESMVVLQMLCKVCMCLLFLKLTSGLNTRQLLVKLLLGYVLGGWLVTEIFFFGFWCNPFVNYFRVFEENTPGCTTSQKHLMMSFAFNITSDLLMLAVPIPMLLQSQLPWKQKATVCGIFGLGSFVILASILNRYYCFAHPESILWIFWYVREASTAIIVTNVPHCYALPRKVFNLGSFGNLVGSILKSKRVKPGKHGESGDAQLGKKSPSKCPVRKGRRSANDSTENFAARSPKPGSTLQIWQRSEYSVDANDSNERHVEDTELETIWAGPMGTTATVEVEMKETQATGQLENALSSRN